MSGQLNEVYVPPPWSARVKSDYFLEVLKNGVKVDQMVLTQKAMYLVGKHGDICDIVLENPTISRKHAVFQGKNTDEIFVYDLGSTHGTFVNNRKITSKLYHKLTIHDQVKFGQSQRVYLLRCDKLEEEVQSPSLLFQDNLTQERQLQERELKKKSRQESRSLKDQYLGLLMKNPQFNFMKPKPKPKNTDEDEGITWGMIDEDEIYRYQQEQDYPLETEVLKKLEGLTTNQLDKIKQYDDKLMKFRQVQDELDEIISKETKQFGIEEGMKRRKEKLQNKAGEYGNELDQAEETLRFVLFGDKTFSRAVNPVHRESSDEDEYYDNTLANKKKKVKIDETLVVEEQKLENTTQSYQDLKKQLEDFINQRNRAQDQLLNLTTLSDQAQKNIVSIPNDEVDALDSFMIQTTNTLLQDSRPVLLARIQNLQNEITNLQDKLRIVKPDYSSATDIFEQKPEKQETFQAPLEPQNKGIKSTLKQLKEISKQQNAKPDSDDEEQILAKANKHFELERKKELEKQRKIDQEQKRQERMALFQMEEQDQDQQPKKVYGSQQQPRSRHFTAREVEQDEQVIDVVQFQ